MTAPDTAALLDALDRVREVRGSVALFDALVADDPDRVARALAAAPRHPTRPAVVAWLGARGVPEPAVEGPAEALARHGITDVDAFVGAARAREAALSRALDEARSERDLALRSANVYALVAVLLAGLAIAGWLTDFGGVPAPEEPEPAPTRSPSDER